MEGELKVGYLSSFVCGGLVFGCKCVLDVFNFCFVFFFGFLKFGWFVWWLIWFD